MGWDVRVVGGDSLRVFCVSVSFLNPIIGRGELASPAVSGTDRIFSRSLNTSVATTTPSFVASSTVRGSGR